MIFLPKPVDFQFFIRIIRNEISPEEEKFFEAWIQNSEKHRCEFRDFVLLWDKTGQITRPPIPDCGKQFIQFQKKLNGSFSGDHLKENTTIPKSLRPVNWGNNMFEMARWIKLIKHKIQGKERIILMQIRIAAILTILYLVFQLLYKGNTELFK